MILDLRSAIANYKLPILTALHIGAHLGEEETLYTALGITPIYVEANPKVFELLSARLPHRECHQVAICNTVGEVDFHVTSFDQSSSILRLKKHKEIYPAIVDEGTITVPCTTVDQLLGDRNRSIDLLNLDIQGAELLALQGASFTLPHVKCIVTEVNRAELYEGCAQIEEMDAFLANFDFQRVETSFKYHPTWGDAMYVRTEFASKKTRYGALTQWLRQLAG